MNLYLIGYRCTGKSTIGRKVAALLGRTFIDADDFLEKEAGRKIRDIFQKDGEKHFRDLESQCLEKLAAREDIVVGTGGGVVLRPENVQRMKATGYIVLLEADAETIHRRMQADGRTAGQRPSLTGKSPFQEIVDMLQARQPFYHAAADARYNTGELTGDDAANRIVAFLREKESKS